MLIPALLLAPQGRTLRDYFLLLRDTSIRAREIGNERVADGSGKLAVFYRDREDSRAQGLIGTAETVAALEERIAALQARIAELEVELASLRARR